MHITQAAAETDWPANIQWKLIHFGAYICRYVRPIIASCTYINHTNIHRVNKTYANKQTNEREEERLASLLFYFFFFDFRSSFIFVFIILHYYVFQPTSMADVCFICSTSIAIFSEFCAFDLCVRNCMQCVHQSINDCASIFVCQTTPVCVCVPVYFCWICSGWLVCDLFLLLLQ